MSDINKFWLRWVVIGVGFAALSGADCVDKIRNISEGLGDLADAIDNGDDDSTDFEDIIDDIEDWFD
jgi:hypothetical protein